DAEGKEVLAIAEKEDFNFAEVDCLGKMMEKDYLPYHVQKVLDLQLVNKSAIEKKNFTVAIDCVNSVGGLAIPAILNALGVKNIIKLNCEPTGQFAHNPEPLPQHLTEISDLLKSGKADVGFVVDPDVDRLAIICENGDMFGEEYTLVSVADYILGHTPGNTCSNMSSTRALSDVTRQHGGVYTASAVGEVNVVTEMKANKAVIGGEGNGGVINPAAHYGRDALVGIALFLSSLCEKNMKVSELRKTFPNYCISKNRIDLTPTTDVDAILAAVKDAYKNERINDKDGVKIDFAEGWVHLRKSNTEPIIRVYSEAENMDKANELAQRIIDKVNEHPNC
ncbi:MAG: phosphoglucosamine mutase, partial [Bacteroidales bacterium]|nr:phosphoglucosamine mutase [Bacteroidales bacterium]